MPEFHFLAATEDGRQESGLVEAESAEEAMRQLAERQLSVFQLEVHTAGSSAAGGWRRKKIRQDELVVLVRELATLANAGISLAQALDTLRDANRDTALFPPLDRMVNAIRGGEGFSSALQQTGLSLPEYVFAMVRAGEATSNLGMALNRAADQMEFDAKMRSQTREALVYPTILISTGTLAILFIFSFVVPRFAGLLKGRIDSLPWISEVVLRAGMFFNQHFIATLVALAAGTALAITASSNPQLRLKWLGLAANLPILGEWIRSGETARWTTALAMLLQSRVAILPSLELASVSVRLAVTASRLEAVRNDVNRGKPLSQAVEHQNLLEPTSLSMIKVGEQSGELAPMLQHVAHYWGEKNQSLQRRVVSLIEPASILVLGIVIGFVMVGVVMAMASLTEVKF
ncbi:type II secretion system F family protein [Chitinilyticum aquatile]|uniref:type II secretion system F family protein n=1 Tax=Chitinilyticum aquatile TaxID=362520 RepID=UPI00048EE35D|nr:type II secretion system F family protein [Chitinilyticum aquatile]